jgi:hypothetical protein
MNQTAVIVKVEKMITKGSPEKNQELSPKPLLRAAGDRNRNPKTQSSSILNNDDTQLEFKITIAADAQYRLMFEMDSYRRYGIDFGNRKKL